MKNMLKLLMLQDSFKFISRVFIHIIISAFLHVHNLHIYNETEIVIIKKTSSEKRS